MATQSQGVSQPIAQNLWEEAFATLDSDLQRAINHKTASGTNIAVAALRTANEKRDICLRKRWRYRKSNGKDIILRDVLDKLVGFLDKFVTVGDTAVQYDPAHASLPWAGVRFVLRAAVSDQRAFGNTVESLETIARLVTQYAVFESLYLGKTTGIQREMAGELMALYSEILKYLARATLYFQKSTVTRVLKSTFDPSEPWSLENLGEMEEKLGRLAHIADSEKQEKTANDVEAVKAILSTFTNPIKRVSIMADAVLKIAEETDYLECLRWLSPAPVFQHHEIHSSNRVQGTGKWLFDHPQHRDWNYSSSSSMLTLHGIPGCGKSTIASAVIDSLMSTGDTAFTPLAYFYCARNTFEVERSFQDDIMRSIVRQLATSKHSPGKIHDAVYSAYEQRRLEAKLSGFDLRKLKLEECVKLILEITESNPAVIVIDAIDEVSKDGQSILLSALKTIISKSANVMKVFVTTRTDSHILALVDKDLTIRVDRNHVKDDIEKLTKHLLALAIDEKRLLRGRVPDPLRKELESSLVQSAGEMFLAVVLQVKNISSQKTDVGLKNAISQLPSRSLDDLYAKRFEDILQLDPVTQKIAFQTFSMLLCTQEPLSPGAVLSAATPKDLKLDIEALIDICSDLILVDSKLDVLRFAHLSVQEFLEAKTEFRTSLNHNRIARICLSKCLQCLSDSAVLEPKTSFYHYGVLYWMRHYEILYQDLDGALHGQELEAFLFEGAGIHFLVWLEEIQRYAELLPRSHTMLRDLTAVCSENSSPIFTICLIGRAEMLTQLCSGNGFDCNEKNALGATALYLASAKGHIEVVKRLLEIGADPNIKGGWFDYPLHAACINGHNDVAICLLGHGADPSCNGKFSGAFEACAFGGQKAIAMTLLDAWLILSQDQYDMVMEQAAYAGFSECIDMLQDRHGSQFGYLGSKQHKLIEQAISRGHIGLLNRILCKSKPGDLPETGVYIAALAGRDDMVHHLLDKGLKLEQHGMLGTPLRAASLMGHVSTVRLLIEGGVDINLTGKVGNALEASAMRGHPAVINVLLQHGIDVNIRGGLFGNALQAAAYNGHGEVVGLLLASGVDVFSQGEFTDSFHAAAEGGHEDIIGALLDRGYRFQIEPPKRSHKRHVPKTKYYERNFRDASPSGKGRQTKPNIKSNNSKAKPTQAQLVSAQEIAHEVESEARIYEYKSPNEIGIMHRSGKHAFQLLAIRGDEVSVRRLLERRIEMRIPEFYLKLAFRGAAGEGHLKVVFAFCELVPDSIETVRWAVQDAAKYGHLDVVKFLLWYNSRQCAQNSEMAQGIRNEPASQDAQGATSSTSTDQDCLQNSSCQFYVFDQVILEAFHASISGNSPAVLEHVLSLLHAEHVKDTLQGAFSSPALTQAADLGSSQIMKLLLHHYAHLFDASTIIGAAGAASLKGHFEPVKLIRENYSGLFNPTAIMATLLPAVEQDHVDISQYLLNLLPEETQQSVVSELYVLAAGNGCVDVLRLLRNDMLNLENKASTLRQACNVAAQNGHASIVKHLLEDGADIRESVTQIPNFRQQAKPSAYQHPPKPCTALQAALWGWQGQYNSSTGWKKGDRQLREDAIAELVRSGANMNEPALDGNTPLHFAIAELSADAVNTMIQYGADVNAISPDGRSGLLAAASRPRKSKRVIALLIDAGAVIQTSEIAGPHPLLAKILNEFFGEQQSIWLTVTTLRDISTDGPGGAVKVLLEKMPRELAKDKRYGLLLHMAAASGDVEFVKLLIQREVNPDATGYYYGSALQAAARIGHLELAKMLLNAGTNVNLIGGRHETAARAAVTGEHFQLLELLVKQGADINLKADKASISIVQLAIERRNQAIFQYLLQNGVDVHNTNGEGESCLMSACAAKEVEMVAKLIVKGADVNAPARLEATSTVFKTAITPLLFACSTGSTELVQLLIDNGAEINNETENHVTPVQIAAVHGHWPIVQLLLQSGASFYPADFVEAARSGGISVVQGLLSVGLVDLDLLSTALEAACLGQQLESVRLLLEELTGTEFEERALYGAKLAACKVRNDRMLQLLLGFDPSPSANVLSAAIAAGLSGSVKVLLETGADPNKADDHRNFPLHVAAYYQRLSIVNTLLDDGANPNLKGSKYGDAIRSVLEGCLAYRILRLHRPHPMKNVASHLPQHLIYTVLDWIEEIETSRKPMKTSISEVVDYEGMTESYFSTFVVTEDIDRCSKLIQTLMDHLACLDSSSGFFGNHLHLAAYLGIGEWLQEFVRMGVDVNENCGYFETPLIAALLGDQISIAEFLIDSGANVNHTSEQHGTALYIACSKSGTFSGRGIEDVVSSLLHHGAHLNNKVHESHNPLNVVLDVSHRIYSSEPTPPDLIIEMLLSRFPNLRVTGENLVKAAEADSHRFDKKPYLELLLGHDQLVQVPEAAILAVLSPHAWSNEKLIKLLLDRYRNGTVSEEMLKTAPSISSLSLLLQHPNVGQISPALTQDELSKTDGLQRVAMLLNSNTELRLDETMISTTSKLISADPSPANLKAFRTIWLKYKSQDDEKATRSLEQLGIPLYTISTLNIL